MKPAGLPLDVVAYAAPQDHPRSTPQNGREASHGPYWPARTCLSGSPRHPVRPPRRRKPRRPCLARGPRCAFAPVDLAGPRFGRNDTNADQESVSPGDSECTGGHPYLEELCAFPGRPQRDSEPEGMPGATGLVTLVLEPLSWPFTCCERGAGLVRSVPSCDRVLCDQHKRTALRQISLPLPLPFRGVILGKSAAFSPKEQSSKFGDNGEKSLEVKWWAEQVSNLRPRPCKGRALPN